MKQIFNDERAENPLEVGMYVLIVLMIMAALMTVVGALLDKFSSVISVMPLKTTWAINEMSTYLGYITWTYRIPVIFIIIVMIWGVRAVIRKHTYTTENGQQYQNTYDEY